MRYDGLLWASNRQVYNLSRGFYGLKRFEHGRQQHCLMLGMMGRPHRPAEGAADKKCPRWFDLFRKTAHKRNTDG